MIEIILSNAKQTTYILCSFTVSQAFSKHDPNQTKLMC